MTQLLTQQDLSRALAIPDLTDPLVAPNHALQKLIRLAQRALVDGPNCPLHTVRSSPVVPIENNYDRLNYPLDGAARDARYTRYVTHRYILRTQTSSAIPDTLMGLNGSTPSELNLLLPGIVYRRDCIDRLHCAEPHQLDIWKIADHRQRKSLTEKDLEALIEKLMHALLPNREWRTIPSPHPYTQQGRQIDVLWHDQWIEVGECGLIAQTILEKAQLSTHTGLAMGLGLDRLLMIRKNIPDIRLLRHPDSRVQEQMTDLSVYQPVSNRPAITRDLSLVVDTQMDIEQIGDCLREHCQHWQKIEELTVVDETAYPVLPQAARTRLGILPEQKNMLLRLVIRDLHTTLEASLANDIRNEVYQLLNQSEVMHMAGNRQ